MAQYEKITRELHVQQGRNGESAEFYSGIAYETSAIKYNSNRANKRYHKDRCSVRLDLSNTNESLFQTKLYRSAELELYGVAAIIINFPVTKKVFAMCRFIGITLVNPEESRLAHNWMK